MQEPTDTATQGSRREPWNKGKLIGAKPPLRPKHVWSIRTKLQIAGRTRDLAMFNLAIDSKLRGCDVVSLRVEDVAPHGHAVDRATVRQKKTGQPVKFELTEQTREAIDYYLATAKKKPGEFLFGGRRGRDRTPLPFSSSRKLGEPGGFAVEEVDRAFQTHPLIFTGVPISEAVALGGALLPRRQPGHLLHDDLEAALDVGDVGLQLIGLARGQRVFVRHTDGLPDGGRSMVRCRPLLFAGLPANSRCRR